MGPRVLCGANIRAAVCVTLGLRRKGALLSASGQVRRVKRAARMDLAGPSIRRNGVGSDLTPACDLRTAAYPGREQLPLVTFDVEC